MGEESGDFNGNISFFEDWICSRICVWVCKFVKKKTKCVDWVCVWICNLSKIKMG